MIFKTDDVRINRIREVLPPISLHEEFPLDEKASRTVPPSTVKAILPILVPILLIVLQSIAKMPTQPFGDNSLVHGLIFLGQPVTALLIGLGLSFLLPENFNREMLSAKGWLGESVIAAASIIIITGSV